MNVYYNPEKFGLATIGEIEWSSGSYEFDTTVVFKREADGAFLYAEDSGCSCPAPFEDTGVDDLTPCTLEEFKAHCAEREGKNYDGPREAETAQLLERMHAAGAR